MSLSYLSTIMVITAFCISDRDKDEGSYDERDSERKRKTARRNTSIHKLPESLSYIKN